jgi:ABC-type Na+ efflux pump permease subunit
MMAIIERELRKFFRSPALMMVSMILPLVQLVVLGNAFGGKVRGARVAVVDYDHGEQSVKVREAFDSVAANIRTFSLPSAEVAGLTDVDGLLHAILGVPEEEVERHLIAFRHREEVPK